MKAIRRVYSALFDSPTFGRDRQNLISGFTIGSAGLLLNGAIMIFVIPLLVNPDDRMFRDITEGIGFGQTLALILLGGATILATLLIPLRLISVFWGPRIGRYFDQIVLSGISPIRFVIGKAMSQNLFLGLILFLLLPYLILCVALGGLDLVSFFAGLFVLWLYCMALALLTIWLSLYLNELLASVFVIIAAGAACALGATPIPFQPFWFSPFPLLMQPVYAASPEFVGGPGGPLAYYPDFATLFFGCTGGISAVIGFALVGIYIGPLYGIIRDNSTFGEVVRPGDSKRKRWFRLRYHIQRPSELAFFYENRSEFSRNMDGFIRWGLSFLGLTAVLLIVRGCFFGFIVFAFTTMGAPGGPPGSFAHFLHIFNLVVHGIAIVLAVFLFSHSRNTLYQKTPFIFGKRAEVAKIDTWAFFLFLSVTTALTVLMPQVLQDILANRVDLFPVSMSSWGGNVTPLNFSRAHIEGTLVLSLAGVTLFLLQRHLCQIAWLRTGAFAACVGAYFAFGCLFPMAPLPLYLELRELRKYEWLREWVPVSVMSSPFGVFGHLFNEITRDLERLGDGDPLMVTTVPFYVLNGVAILILLFLIRRTGRKLREWYLQPSSNVSQMASVLSEAVKAEAK